MSSFDTAFNTPFNTPSKEFPKEFLHELSHELSHMHSNESFHEPLSISSDNSNKSSRQSFGGLSDGVSNGATKGSSSGDSTRRTTPPQSNLDPPKPGRDATTKVALRQHLSRFVDHATTLDDNTKSLGEVIDDRLDHRMRKAEVNIPSIEPNLEFDEEDRDAILNDTTTPEWANEDNDEAPKQWKEYTGKQLLEAAHLERASQWFWGRSMEPREKKEKSRFFPKP